MLDKNSKELNERDALYNEILNVIKKSGASIDSVMTALNKIGADVDAIVMRTIRRANVNQICDLLKEK